MALLDFMNFEASQSRTGRFSCKKVRKGIATLNASPLNFYLTLISPYPSKSKIHLTPEERLLYKQRWRIETLFGVREHKGKPFRLWVGVVRRCVLRKAKLFLSALAWNWSKRPL